MVILVMDSELWHHLVRLVRGIPGVNVYEWGIQIANPQVSDIFVIELPQMGVMGVLN